MNFRNFFLPMLIHICWEKKSLKIKNRFLIKGETEQLFLILSWNCRQNLGFFLKGEIILQIVLFLLNVFRSIMIYKSILNCQINAFSSITESRKEREKKNIFFLRIMIIRTIRLILILISFHPFLSPIPIQFQSIFSIVSLENFNQVKWLVIMQWMMKLNE